MSERICNGRVFRKSSFSNHPNPYPQCVYVSVSDSDVLVANLDAADGTVIRYTHDEWSAFIRGAKAGEFDL